jgi:Tfp pilus assembly protein PilF
VSKCHFWLALPALLLLGCQTTQKPSKTVSYVSSNSPWKKTLEAVTAHVNEGNLQDASKTVNLALQNFPNQACLHLLNGLVYEKMGANGGDQRDLAGIAYQNAIHLDKSHWYAFYLLGRLRRQDGFYPEAQNLFSKALMLKPNTPEVLYELAMSSYYAQDLKAARIAIEETLIHGPKPPKSLTLRAAALIFAANGMQKRSQECFAALQERVGKDPDLMALKERIDHWNSLYNTPPSPKTKLYTPVAGEVLPPQVPAPDPNALNQQIVALNTSTQAAQSVAYQISQMNRPKQITEERVLTQEEFHEAKKQDASAIIFNCYMLTIKDKVSTNKGINILGTLSKGLSLTLQPQSADYTLTNTITNGTSSTGMKKTFDQALTWSSVTYNMNMLNVADDYVEIMARPTLSAFLNEPAFFSSGILITAGIAGNTGGSVITIPTGVIMKITPLKIDEEDEDQYITFEVELESSVPPSVADGGLTAQVLKFSKTKMHTTLRLKFNETGQIGGLYESIRSTQKQGIPLLSDIPLLKLVTSNATQDNIKSSVLFLITPRRSQSNEERVRKSFVNLRSRAELKKKLPSLEDWINKTSPLYTTEPSLRIILEHLTPSNAEEFFRRGDVLPVNPDSEEQSSFQKEVASLSYFLE